MSRRGPKPSGPILAKLTVLAEKTRYPFSAYPRTRCKDLLFAGCALPSQLPRTTDALARLCRSHGCGVAYDCCGKPLADWGEARAAGRALDRLAGRLRRLDCERLVVACPNCLDHLQGHLAVPCVSVYEALAGWGFSPAVPLPAGVLFSPCPDRRGRRLEGQLRALADLSGGTRRWTASPAAGCAPTPRQGEPGLPPAAPDASLRPPRAGASTRCAPRARDSSLGWAMAGCATRSRRS